MEYVNLIAGIYLSAFTFLMRTENFKSTVLFCIIPGLIGFWLMATSLIVTGWVN